MTSVVDSPAPTRSLSQDEEEGLLAAAVPTDAVAGGRSPSWLPTLLSILLAPTIVGLWIVARQLDLVHDILLPDFVPTVAAFWDVITADAFAMHLRRTVTEIVLGYGLGCTVGLGLGIGLSSFPLLRKAYFPLLAGFEAIPGIVLAPVIITWLGFGMSGKMVQAAIACFFPVFVTTLVGLSMVTDNELRLMRVLKASRWQTFRQLRIRSALPAIFGGLKIAITTATIGAVVSEFVGADAGLGFLLLRYKASYETEAMFALIFIFGVIGSCSFLLLELLERKVVFWRSPS
jgi:NitT/TauT family transport system permease protein